MAVKSLTMRSAYLLEPLVWLKRQGFKVPKKLKESLLSNIRKIIEADLSQSWTPRLVANKLAVSVSTMRRRLAENGQGFTKILINTRLEFGLSLL